MVKVEGVPFMESAEWVGARAHCGSDDVVKSVGKLKQFAEGIRTPSVAEVIMLWMHACPLSLLLLLTIEETEASSGLVCCMNLSERLK